MQGFIIGTTIGNIKHHLTRDFPIQKGLHNVIKVCITKCLRMYWSQGKSAFKVIYRIYY